VVKMRRGKHLEALDEIKNPRKKVDVAEIIEAIERSIERILTRERKHGTFKLKENKALTSFIQIGI
jgi:hypothetical protein